MGKNERKYPRFRDIKLSNFINENTLRNVFYMTAGIVVFIFGVVVYGIILNSLEDTLQEEMLKKGYPDLKEVNILVDRKTFTLSIFEDTVLIKTYRASFGRNINIPKSRANDNATPVGEYKICDIDTAYKYYKFLKLNYPNLNDASEALRKGLISQREFDQLKFEFYYEDCPKLETVLGNNVGIHGIGDLNYIFKNLPFVYNWTDGSIAIKNESIDEILSIVKKGKKVLGNNAKAAYLGFYEDNSKDEIVAGIEIDTKEELGIKFALLRIKNNKLEKGYETGLLEGSFNSSYVKKIKFPSVAYELIYYNSQDYYMGSGGGEIFSYIFDFKIGKVYYAHLVIESKRISLFLSHNINDQEVKNFFINNFKKDYPAFTLVSQDFTLD